MNSSGGSSVTYYITVGRDTIIVRGTLDIRDGQLVHNLQYACILSDYQRILVSIKVGRIEDNYVQLMNRGLSILLGAVIQRAKEYMKSLEWGVISGSGFADPEIIVSLV